MYCLGKVIECDLAKIRTKQLHTRMYALKNNITGYFVRNNKIDYRAGEQRKKKWNESLNTYRL
jgi:hypothetical protein